MYYNIMTSAGKVEVKLHQSEIELIEQKLQQKQMEVDFFTGQLQRLKEKIQKLEQHLRNQKKAGDETLDDVDSEYSYAYTFQLESDELELVRLQTEGLSTESNLSTADCQKHQLECERKMQNQEILSILNALSSTDMVIQHKTLKHGTASLLFLVSIGRSEKSRRK